MSLPVALGLLVTLFAIWTIVLVRIVVQYVWPWRSSSGASRHVEYDDVPAYEVDDRARKDMANCKKVFCRDKSSKWNTCYNDQVPVVGKEHVHLKYCDETHARHHRLESSPDVGL